MSLSARDKAELLALIAADKPVPRALLEPLLALPDEGEFLWPGKTAPDPAPPHLCLRRDAASVPRNAAIDPEGAHNLLFHCDNLALLYTLVHAPVSLPQMPKQRPRLIYLDPPFAVGADFFAGRDGEKVPAFSDKWENLAGWLNMLRPRLKLMRERLADDGCLCLHCDRRTVAPARLLLDECFGKSRFINEIIWHYTGGGRSKSRFSQKHDTLLLYAKSGRRHFNADAVRVPYKPGSGYAAAGITARSGKHYLPNPLGTPVDDVWDIPMLNPLSSERTGYAVQKPERLLERLIAALTEPGDLVEDYFCGSGTTAAVAHKTGRQWLACDAGPAAAAIAATRLRNLGAAFTLYRE